MRKINLIRRSLSTDPTGTLVTSLLCSKLDYCNTIFAGLPNSMIDRLQNLLHSAALSITGVRKYDHIAPTLRHELHWLPVSNRITIKLCLIDYKALHDMTPSYIRELARIVDTTHYRSRLRSATYCIIVVPRTRLDLSKTAFAVAVPTARNNLPLSVRLAP